MAKATYTVTGMTCEHCVTAVTEEISALPGVSGVEVFLVPNGESTVAVVSDVELDRSAVSGAVEEAGYVLA